MNAIQNAFFPRPLSWILLTFTHRYLFYTGLHGLNRFYKSPHYYNNYTRDRYVFIKGLISHSLDMAMREGGDSVDFDNILSHIGEMGRYQLTLYLLLCIPATLPAAFLAFNQETEPQHWCKVGALLDYRDSYHNISSEHIKRISIPKLSNVSKDYHKCIRYVVNYTDLYVQNGYKWPNEPNINWPTEKCMEGWIYDRSEFKDTLVTELDLVCEKNWWPSTSTALFYVGSLFGNILFGHIADKYGRRTSSINGFTFPALFQIPFILSIEIMGPGYRTFAGMMICLFFAVALMILAGLAYIFNSCYWFFVPESPRWLLSYNRVEEAEVIIQSIAKWNKKEIPENFVQIFIDEIQNPWITVSLAMIGKFQIAASFAVIYVYAGELMPTVVRSEAMGISSFVAGIGLLIFPYINSLGDISQFLPLVIMGTLSVMGGITALFLPETLGKHLPNTLEEGEGFGNHFSMFSCPQKNSTRGSILNLDETENIFLEEFPKELKSQSNGKIDAV
ncbi:SLC22A4_5 [Lepeophtheirus salmonis]|uniref:SLC22A4_5 n=1 Tax=Lepeophtheirus salmonis TaxID=72036 RepID=A0A7R8D2P1_LEPSM|nr:SLC22A4_5 [Lepeophtheirus salmonis]CAF3003511.1 SLC22A4_5 [Lepeophtheirus salmonis]